MGSWLSDLFDTVVPSSNATTQTGNGDYSWVGPVLSVGSELLGGIFAQKAQQKAAADQFEREKELLRLKAELSQGGGGGGGGAAAALAKKQLLQNAYANWIASNNQSAQLVGESVKGIGGAAAKAYTRSY